jgi:hypothetical protein
VTIHQTGLSRNPKHASIVRSPVVDELVDRAAGSPIYLATNTIDFNRAYSAAPLASLRASYPSTNFVWSRGLYKDSDDWRRRWPNERGKYAAAIVLTFAPWGGDPYSGLIHEHTIGSGTLCEIESLSWLGRPILWQANEFPAVLDISRFLVEPLPEMRRVRMARLVPDPHGKPFCPEIFSWFAVSTAAREGEP